MVEGLQLSGLGVNAFNRAAELLTHQPVLPKALGALGWDWRGGRALPAAGGVVGFSLPNTRTEKIKSLSHPGECPVEGQGCGELLLVQGMAWGLWAERLLVNLLLPGWFQLSSLRKWELGAAGLCWCPQCVPAGRTGLWSHKWPESKNKDLSPSPLT